MTLAIEAGTRRDMMRDRMTFRVLTLVSMTALMASTANAAATPAPAPAAQAHPAVAAAAKPATAPAAKPSIFSRMTSAMTSKPAAAPAAKPAVHHVSATANGRMVTTKTSTGKTITYNCSKAGNANKKACQ